MDYTLLIGVGEVENASNSWVILNGSFPELPPCDIVEDFSKKLIASFLGKPEKAAFFLERLVLGRASDVDVHMVFESLDGWSFWGMPITGTLLKVPSLDLILLRQKGRPSEDQISFSPLVVSEDLRP